MSKGRNVIALVVVIVAAAAAYKLVIAPAPPPANAKVEGDVYVLPKEFLINLADGRFAKVALGLLLADGQLDGGGHGAPPPEGFGTLAQEPLVRDIVTDTLTNADAQRLTSREGRRELKREIVEQVRRRTDVEVKDVLLMDVTVQ